MSKESYLSARRARLLLVPALVAGVALSACGGDDDDFSGGCDKFGLYAQNRWAPLGAAVREYPHVLAPKLEHGFAPNEVVAVDGWVATGEPAYPTNPPPWDSDVWFHLANSDGWVSFAAVRLEPTSPDPTGLSSDGGQPAPTIAECEGTYQP